MRKSILQLLLVCLPMVYTIAQNSNNFVQLLELSHFCENNNGQISLALNGDPTTFNYYWLHGATTLSIDNLSPGIYTIVVNDYYGCVESYDFEILDIQACSFNYAVTNDDCSCKTSLQVQVLTNNGSQLTENELSINWTDGASAGLNRIVSRSSQGIYCVEVALAGETCCYDVYCFNIAEDKTCEDSYQERGKVIVNEIHREQDGKCQFVELLVTGNCRCQKNVDIKGYILDDNEGTMIKGNSFVNEFNKQTIGIDDGYLIFKDHNLWANLPIGSIILIYNDREGCADLPASDPYDSNEDNVYVISAYNTTLIKGAIGTWVANEKRVAYTGTPMDVLWDFINFSAVNDGIQVRDAEGDYEHGISLGHSAYAQENDFPMWVYSEDYSACNCQFVQTDYTKKEHYTCETTALSSSPGMANSEENATIINQLLACHEISNSPSGQGTKPPSNGQAQPNTVAVSPNPFNESLLLHISNQTAGQMKGIIRDLNGQVQFSFSEQLLVGENNIDLQPSPKLKDGIYILHVVFATGQQENIKLVHLSY